MQILNVYNSKVNCFKCKRMLTVNFSSIFKLVFPIFLKIRNGGNDALKSVVLRASKNTKLPDS